MVTTMQAEALAGALWDYNVEHVATILKGLERERTFLHAAVIDAKGKVVAQDLGAGTSADDAASRDVLALEAPSVLEEGARHENVGTLRVAYSRRELDEAWWRRSREASRPPPR